jgi:uroporphyrinogen-III synthase
MADLRGKTVVVTRAEADAGPLRQRLESRGARVITVPAVSFEAAGRSDQLSRSLEALSRTAWVAFASRNGVRFFDAILAARHVALPERSRLAALGTGTAEEIGRRFRPPDLIATVSTAEGLAASLLRTAHPHEGEILLPSAHRGRRVLAQMLRDAGFRVRRLTVYRTRVARSEDGPVSLPDHIDFVLFTSPSTVRGFLACAGWPAGAEVVSIGPVTSRAAREAGLSVAREARRHDLEGLLEVLT